MLISCSIEIKLTHLGEIIDSISSTNLANITSLNLADVCCLPTRSHMVKFWLISKKSSIVVDMLSTILRLFSFAVIVANRNVAVF